MDSTVADPNDSNRNNDDDGSSSIRRKKKGLFNYLLNKDASALLPIMIGLVTVIYLIAQLVHMKKRRSTGGEREGLQDSSMMGTGKSARGGLCLFNKDRSHM